MYYNREWEFKLKETMESLGYDTISEIFGALEIPRAILVFFAIICGKHIV